MGVDGTLLSSPSLLQHPPYLLLFASFYSHFISLTSSISPYTHLIFSVSSLSLLRHSFFSFIFPSSPPISLHLSSLLPSSLILLSCSLSHVPSFLHSSLPLPSLQSLCIIDETPPHSSHHPSPSPSSSSAFSSDSSSRSSLQSQLTKLEEISVSLSKHGFYVHLFLAQSLLYLLRPLPVSSSSSSSLSPPPSSTLVLADTFTYPTRLRFKSPYTVQLFITAKPTDKYSHPPALGVLVQLGWQKNTITFPGDTTLTFSLSDSQPILTLTETKSRWRPTHNRHEITNLLDSSKQFFTSKLESFTYNIDIQLLQSTQCRDYTPGFIVSDANRTQVEAICSASRQLCEGVPHLLAAGSFDPPDFTSVVECVYHSNTQERAHNKEQQLQQAIVRENAEKREKEEALQSSEALRKQLDMMRYDKLQWEREMQLRLAQLQRSIGEKEAKMKEQDEYIASLEKEKEKLQEDVRVATERQTNTFRTYNPPKQLSSEKPLSQHPEQAPDTLAGSSAPPEEGSLKKHQTQLPPLAEVSKSRIPEQKDSQQRASAKKNTHQTASAKSPKRKSEKALNRNMPFDSV